MADEIEFQTKGADVYIMNIIYFCKSQLSYYLEYGMSPDPGYTQRDITAYQELLDKNDPEIAMAFLTRKAESRRQGKPVENLAIIAELKKDGTWK